MITRIFKYNTNFQLFVLLLTGILLWLPAFYKGCPMYKPDELTFGYNFIYRYLCDYPLLYTSVAFVLLMGESLLLNNLLAEYNVAPRNSYLTAFFYILMMSSTPDLLTLHPLLIVNAIIIILLLMLFKIKTKEEGYKEIFISGLLIGISSLFYIKSAGLILIVWIFLLIFHTYSWREWIISILGFIIVYFYLFAYFLLTDQLSGILKLYENIFSNISFGSNQISFSVFQYITLVIIAFLFFVSLMKLFFVSREKIIYVRKVFHVIFWMFIVNALSMLFLVENFIYEFSYLLLPVSVLIAYYYQNIKRIIFSEIVLLMLIASIILQKIFTG